MTTSDTTTSSATPKAAYLRHLVEERISNPAKYVGDTLNPEVRQRVEALAAEMITAATNAAKYQGESFLPLTRLGPDDVRIFLRYSRQDPGSPVLPHHGLTLQTQTLFHLLYGEGFRLEQRYTGPCVPSWEDTGPQQLLLRW